MQRLFGTARRLDPVCVLGGDAYSAKIWRTLHRDSDTSHQSQGFERLSNLAGLTRSKHRGGWVKEVQRGWGRLDGGSRGVWVQLRVGFRIGAGLEVGLG